MYSAEELQMFATEGENSTKDIGDVGQAFGAQAVDEDLVQGYRTSYWDSVPDWAKGEDGKWMIAYTGATTFLTNIGNYNLLSKEQFAGLTRENVKCKQAAIRPEMIFLAGECDTADTGKVAENEENVQDKESLATLSRSSGAVYS